MCDLGLLVHLIYMVLTWFGIGSLLCGHVHFMGQYFLGSCCCGYLHLLVCRIMYVCWLAMLDDEVYHFNVASNS